MRHQHYQVLDIESIFTYQFSKMAILPVFSMKFVFIKCLRSLFENLRIKDSEVFFIYIIADTIAVMPFEFSNGTIKDVVVCNESDFLWIVGLLKSQRIQNFIFNTFKRNRNILHSFALWKSNSKAFEEFRQYLFK